MKIGEVLNFENIDFDNQEIPSYVEKIEKDFEDCMEKNNYILSHGEYDEFAAMWARVGDWYDIQHAKSVYNETNLENKLNELYDIRKKDAPVECKTDAAKKRWVQQNTPEFYSLANKYDRAKAYHAYFENKLKALDKKHYLCKAMSNSFDKTIGRGSF